MRPNSCSGLHYDHPTMPCQSRRACASDAQTEPLFISALSLYLPSFYLSPASSSTLLLCPLLPFCYLSCGSSFAFVLHTAAPFVWDPWVTFLSPFSQHDLRPKWLSICLLIKLFWIYVMGGEITSVLLLCYQFMYSSCNTTALHVAVAALKVLGSLYSSARSESGNGQRRPLACLLYTLVR